MKQNFLTIRETAALGILSEHRLRELVRQRKCPGIYAGNRFLINVSTLQEMLDDQSLSSMTQGVRDGK